MEMASSMITFTLFFFCTFLFSVEVIFERVVTFIFEKRFKCSPECFIICYISCTAVAKKCFLCFSNNSNAVVTLLVVCFSLYFAFEFVSETSLLYDFFNYSFINEGSKRISEIIDKSFIWNFFWFRYWIICVFAWCRKLSRQLNKFRENFITLF